MASSDQIKALIRSHSEGDDSLFYSIAMQMAAQAARQGPQDLQKSFGHLLMKLKKKALNDQNQIP